MTDDQPQREDSFLFDGSMLEELIAQSANVRRALADLVNKCWYTDELVVVYMQTPENFALYQSHFLDNLGGSFQIVTIEADDQLTTEELLAEIVEATGQELEEDEEDYGYDEEDQETLLQRLAEHVDSLAERSSELLIQISEAQELAPEVLGDLASVVSRNATMVTPHFVLWAGASSEVPLRAAFAGSRIEPGIIDVPRFQPREIADYLKVVFRRNGERMPFGKETLQQIIRRSKGIASRIDLIVAATLYPDDFQFDDPDPEGRRWPMPSLAVAGVIGVLALVFFLQIQRSGEDQDSEAADTVAIVVNPEPAVGEVLTDVSGNGSVSAPTEGPIAVPRDVAATLRGSDDGSETADTPRRMRLESEDVGESPARSGNSQLVNITSPQDADAPRATVVISPERQEDAGDPMADDQDLPDSPARNSSEAIVAGSSDPVVEGSPDPVAVNNSGSTENNYSVPVVDAVPVSVTSSPDIPVAEPEPRPELPEQLAAGYGDEAYRRQLARLLTHDDSESFIQVLGTYSEEEAVDFTSRYSIDDSFYYFRTDLGGRDWFVVVYGGFATERIAIEVRETLTGRLAAGGPWIRNMDNIRASVK